jgi:hypothetical protein
MRSHANIVRRCWAGACIREPKKGEVPMPPPAADFRGAPATFMGDNVIVVDRVEDEKGDLYKNSVRFFTLTQVNAQVQNKPAGAVYALTFQVRNTRAATRWDRGNNDEIRGYWCPYRAEDCLGTMVGNEADYMFTATMNGCSFGVGSATSDGSRAVYHANKGSLSSGVDLQNQRSVEKGFKAMRKAQKKALRGLQIAKGNIIDVEEYGGGLLGTNMPVVGQVFAITNTCTTVGLRTNTGWDF